MGHNRVMKRFAFVAVLVLSAGLAMSQAKDYSFAIGGGLGYEDYAHDEQWMLSGDLEDVKATYQFWGANLFMDLTKYLTVYGGVWLGLPGTQATGAGPVTQDKTYANTLIELEIGATVKYPISVSSNLVFAPKFGFSDQIYLAGQSGASAPTTAGKQGTSPFSAIVGADVDYAFPTGLLLRLPINAGWGLNSRTGGATGKYVSTYSVSFSTGVSVGYRL
jgi:hypothetical protein